MTPRRSVVWAAALALPVACGPAATTPPAAKPSAPEPPAVLADADWGRFRSQRQGLSVPLPDGKAWRIDDHTSSWLDARHGATESRLRARSWIEPKPVSREHCEAQARRFAPDLPVLDAGSTIEDRVADGVFAPDFSARLVVGIGGAEAVGEQLEGHVLVFGASARQCVALVFSAKVQGPGASAVLGERLELGTRIAESTIFVSRLPEGPLEPAMGP